MNCLEACRIIFNKDSLTNLSDEYRAVANFCIETGLINANEVKEAVEDYKPPRNFLETLARINYYIPHKLDKDKLSPQQRKDADITQALLNDARFVFTVNSYITSHERELFEGEFIKSIYNKVSDCSNEEISQFMNLSASVVTEMQYMAELNLYKETARRQLQENSNVAKNVADRISSLEKNIFDVKDSQNKLIKILQGERSKRLESKISENSSVHAIIAGWKQKQFRDRMIKLAQLRDRALKDEAERIDSMDALKAQLFGIDKTEI
jgi:hypothetical protein